MRKLGAFIKTRKGQVITGLVVAFLAVVAPIATSASTPRDYDANAICYGGTYSTSELKDCYNNGTKSNKSPYSSASSVQATWKAAGVSTADFTKLVNGRVHKDGRVTVDNWQGDKNYVAATGAKSTGHNKTRNSVSYPGNNTYLRPTSDSFVSGSIPAYVHMEGGVFKYAIIKSCGNVTIGTKTGTPKPALKKYVTRVSEDNYKDAQTASSAVHVDSSEDVVYKVTATNKGKAYLMNAYILDKLPAGIELVDRDSYERQNIKYFRSTRTVRINIGNIAPGKTVTRYYRADVTSDKTDVIKNVATLYSDKQNPVSDPAHIKPKRTVFPSYVCDYLKLNRTNGVAEIKATTNNAVNNGEKHDGVQLVVTRNGDQIANKFFENTDNENTTVNRDSSVDYTQHGKYVLTAYVVEGDDKKTSDDCKVEFTVVKALAKCTSLDVVAGDDKFSRTFTANISTQNTTVDSVDFDFGDGNTEEVDVDNNKATVTHKYDSAGDYTVVATVSNGDDSDDCRATVKIEQPEPEVVCTSMTAVASSDNRFALSFEANVTSKNTTPGEVTFTFGDGNDATAQVVNGKATADHTYAEAGTYNAKATVANQTADSNCAYTVSIDQPEEPAIDVEKVVTTNLQAGENADGFAQGVESVIVKQNVDVRFIFKITNTGNVAYTMDYVDEVPAGLQAALAAYNGTDNAFEPGEVLYVAFDAKAAEAGEYTNTVCAEAKEYEDVEDCDDASVEVVEEPVGAFMVSKKVTTDVDAEANEANFTAAEEVVNVQPGSSVRFLIKVTNTGETKLVMQAVDTLPSELTYLAGDLDQTIELESGDSIYFTVDASAETAYEGQATNTVCVSADVDNDDEKEQACDDASVTVTEEPETPTTPEEPTPEEPTPQVLPSTGPMATFGAMLGLGTLGQAARMWLSSYRELQNAGLNK